jgi:predicted ATPase
MGSIAKESPSPIVVGREEELAALSDSLDSLSAGPMAFVLEGEAGIGKTTLWKEGVLLARTRGFRVLMSRPVPAEAQLPFAALGDLLDRALDDSMSALPDPQRHAVDVALLRIDAQGSPVDQRAVSLGVLGMVRAMAHEGTVILAMDDVQSIDPPSAAVIEFVLRRLEDEPVGVMASVRAGEGGRDPLGLSATFPDDRLRRVVVGPLEDGPIDRVLLSRLGEMLPPGSIQQLHRTSGGNPMFAIELGRAMLRRGIRALPEYALPIPEALRDLVRERLAALRAHVGRVLLVISALSNPTVALVTAVLGSLERTASSLAEAIKGGVIEVEDDRLRFSHPLISSVVYSDTPPDRRRQMHQRLAEVVRDIEERARHLALAAEAPDAEVAAALDDAARRARDRGAPSSAAELSEMASRLTPAGMEEAARRRTIAAAEYHFEAGDMGRARLLLQEVVRSAEPGLVRAEALRRLANGTTTTPRSRWTCSSRAWRRAGRTLRSRGRSPVTWPGWG